MSRPLARRSLVVKLRDLVELVVCEQPKVEQCRGKGRVDVARGQLDERCKRQGHLLDLLVERLVAGGSSCAEACGIVAIIIIVVVVAVTVPWHVGGRWGIVVAALVHAEVVHCSGSEVVWYLLGKSIVSSFWC